MKRLLFLLVCALLLLLASAAPAPASYPVTWNTETAYVHIWFGGDPDDPVPWSEFDSLDPDTANWIWHWEGEAIPETYDVCIAMIMADPAPRGQIANYKNNMPASFKMSGPDARMPLSMGTKAARKYWNPPEVWWMTPLFNKENGKAWAISWTYNFGPMAPGTYKGTSTWRVKHNSLSFGIPDPLPDGPLKPTHIEWRGMEPVTAPFFFTVGD